MPDKMRAVSIRQFSTLHSAVFLLSGLSFAQSASPQVKVNMINACAPSPDDKQEIATALAHVPKQPKFGPDFEVDRGRSSIDEKNDLVQSAAAGGGVAAGTSSADWVRVRREYPAAAMFSTVQYSFSTDAKLMVETVVFRVRDPKDLLEISIEDSASAVTTPANMLETSTPATRIKLERFGKSSVVLARCYATESASAPDQSAYEPLFQAASDIVSDYRKILGARQMVPGELARVGGSTVKPKAKSTGVKSAPSGAATETP
jgi:hypothetical protein